MSSGERTVTRSGGSRPFSFDAASGFRKMAQDRYNYSNRPKVIARRPPTFPSYLASRKRNPVNKRRCARKSSCRNADHVPIAFLSIETQREAAHVTLGVRGTTLARHR
jgi:hypothetical protein